MSKRQIAVLFLCSLVPWAFGAGAVPLLPVYATQLGASPAQVGASLALAYVAIAVGSASASWVAGVFGSYKIPIILSNLVSLPVTWGMGHVSSVWGLTLVTALVWYCGGLGIALISIVAGLQAGDDERGKVFGILSLGVGLGSLLGGLAMGAAVDRWGFRTLFSVAPAFLVVYQAFAVFVVDVKPGTQVAESDPITSLSSLGGGYFLYLAASVLSATSLFVFTLGRSVVMNDMRFGALALSSTGALAGVVGIPLPILLGLLSDRTGRKRYLALSYVAGVAALGILARSTALWHFMVASVLSAFLGGVGGSVGSALVTDLVPRPALPRALAWAGATAWVGGILGFAGTGVALERLGVGPTFAIGMALSAMPLALLAAIRVARRGEAGEQAARAVTMDD